MWTDSMNTSSAKTDYASIRPKTYSYLIDDCDEERKD